VPGAVGGVVTAYNRYTTEKCKQPKKREGALDALLGVLNGFKSNSERQLNWTFEQNISLFPFAVSRGTPRLQAGSLSRFHFKFRSVIQPTYAFAFLLGPF
jgi:hypothetical protein